MRSLCFWSSLLLCSGSVACSPGSTQPTPASPSSPVLDLTGRRYTLTLTVSATCSAQLPEAQRVRRFEARVTQTGDLVFLELGDPSGPVYRAGFVNGSIRAGGTLDAAVAIVNDLRFSMYEAGGQLTAAGNATRMTGLVNGEIRLTTASGRTYCEARDHGAVLVSQ